MDHPFEASIAVAQRCILENQISLAIKFLRAKSVDFQMAIDAVDDRNHLSPGLCWVVLTASHP